MGLVRRHTLPVGLMHLCTASEATGILGAAATAAYTQEEQFVAATTSACSSILLLVMIFIWGASWACILPVVAAEVENPKP